MRNRFSALGRHYIMMLCVLTACGFTWSCKDEYVIDDEKPSWLNTSVYKYLQDHGHYTNYLQLLDDPVLNPKDSATGEYLTRPFSEVLNRTGSKTVFVATDEAWDAFYKRNATLPANNPWHNATSYSNLSIAQKKLLLHTSMLNNAIVMENLASSDGSGSTPPSRGMYMRRYTDVMLTDSIMFLPAEEIPYTYNEDETNYWRRFRPENDGKGIYLVNDSTLSMMLHFTAEHMSRQNINDNDFSIFMGRTRETPDVHIYDARLLYKDSVCENGYVNVTEKVLLPLPNMAEMIRTNGQTRIFSHMLDRFSFPYYNAKVTRDYKALFPQFTDSIFTKKYFSKFGIGHNAVLYGPDGKRFRDNEGDIALKFDPGWNEFYDEVDRRCDMAAMFVPNDKTLFEYFSEGGGGWQLVQTYSKDPMAEVPEGDYEALFRKIDDIPLSTLQALINVIMFPSFTGSVPSKMTSLRNDAQEDMFSPDDVNMIDTCLLACNGAIYIMNKVYGPADYTSVAAPAYISKNNLVMKWAIYNGNIEKDDQMKINYYAYLKAMKSRFVFFLPSDQALQYYYDPISMSSKKPRVLALEYYGKASSGTNLPLKNKLYQYATATGSVGKAYTNEDIADEEIINRLKDILESHTIVLDGSNPIDSRNEYFLTKNGSAIKMTRDAEGNIVKVQGGFQLENERKGFTNQSPGVVSISIDPSNTHNLENGRTYVLEDSPIVPATSSVYSILTSDTTESNPFQRFYELTIANTDIITRCGLVNNSLSQENRRRLLQKYQTFVGGVGGTDYNVQYFNNYNYTVMVPSNEAIEQAIADGLPTWESILEDYESLPHPLVDSTYTEKDERGRTVTKTAVDENGDTIKVYDRSSYVLSTADSLRLQAKITYLNNFIRAHFLDNSVFQDKESMDETDFVSSSYDSNLGVFVKAHISRVPNADGSILYVRDDHNGSPIPVDQTYNNIMARDIECVRNKGKYTPTGAASMNGITLQASSFAVIHLINGVLNHTDLVNGKHVIDWNNPEACKRYIRRYGVYQGDRAEAAKAAMKKQLQKRF